MRCDHFKYLGSLSGEDDTAETDVRARLGAARSAKRLRKKAECSVHSLSQFGVS